MADFGDESDDWSEAFDDRYDELVGQGMYWTDAADLAYEELQGHDVGEEIDMDSLMDGEAEWEFDC